MKIGCAPTIPQGQTTTVVRYFHRVIVASIGRPSAAVAARYQNAGPLSGEEASHDSPQAASGCMQAIHLCHGKVWGKQPSLQRQPDPPQAANTLPLLANQD